MSSSPTDVLVDVTMPQMGVSVAEGTVVGWRVEGRRPDRGRPADLRHLDGQDRHRGALAGVGRGGRDRGAGRSHGGGWDGAGADRHRRFPAPVARWRQRRPLAHWLTAQSLDGVSDGPSRTGSPPQSLDGVSDGPRALAHRPSRSMASRRARRALKPNPHSGPATDTAATPPSSSGSRPSTASTCHRFPVPGEADASASRTCWRSWSRRRRPWSRRCTSRARTGPSRLRPRRCPTAVSSPGCAARSAST